MGPNPFVDVSWRRSIALNSRLVAYWSVVVEEIMLLQVTQMMSMGQSYKKEEGFSCRSTWLSDCNLLNGVITRCQIRAASLDTFAFMVRELSASCHGCLLKFLKRCQDKNSEGSHPSSYLLSSLLSLHFTNDLTNVRRMSLFLELDTC